MERDACALKTAAGRPSFSGAQTRVSPSRHLGNLKLTWRIRWVVDNSWTWGDRWQSAQILSARYIHCLRSS
jgi:hypothetical protein